MQPRPLRIAAELSQSEHFEPITSPFDGALVGEVASATADELDAAIEVSVRGFEIMRELPTHRRVDILEGAARGIAERADEFVRLMALEGGKPVRFGRGEVERARLTFMQAAGEARSARGEVLPVDLEPRAEGRLCLTTRVPLGPVAAIAPFNFPLNLVAHKLAPAIAVGTSVVLKPAPQCPLSAHLLADVLLAAGLPPEALAVVPCEPTVAQRLVQDERMRVLSFTGSDAVGWRLKSLSGKKKVLLELGGNAPCVVDRGSDLDQVLPPILTGAWAHAGQVCIKVQRILVHDSLHEEFLARFVAASRELVCGDPLQEETVVGPMIGSEHVERVLDWIRQAREAGAVVHCGGHAQGTVVAPTVLSAVQADMRVCRDEVFGPVTTVEPFEDFGAALQACNATRFGLQAGVFTPDLGRALEAYRTLEYGGVLINDVPTFRTDNVPYGGSKDSGLGREGVRSAMDELCEPKLLVLRGLSGV